MKHEINYSKSKMLSSFLKLLLLIVGGFILSQLITLGILASTEAEISNESLKEASPWTIKLILLSTHIFTFIIPCLLFVFLNYKERKWSELRLNRPITPTILVLFILFLMVSYPAVSYSFTVNSWLPLADWMVNQEQATAQTLQKVLEMNSLVEFLSVLAIIAIIPAIGEELLFRGLIMDFFEKSTQKGHLAVWASALVFSLFHLQFQGFLPRLLLGAILGYAFLYTRNLWIPIILHFLNNAAPVVSLYFFDSDLAAIDPNDTPEIPWYAGLISLALGVSILYYIINKYKKEIHREA